MYLYHHPIKEKSFLFYLNLIFYIAVKGDIVCALSLCKCDIINIPLYLYSDDKKIYFYHFLLISNMKYKIHLSQRNPVHKRFLNFHDKGKCIKNFSYCFSYCFDVSFWKQPLIRDKLHGIAFHHFPCSLFTYRRGKNEKGND